jgi:biotin carboxyl carrier protein
VQATIDQRAYSLRLREVEPGVFWLERDGRSIEIAVFADRAGYQVRLGAHRLGVEVLDRRAVLARRDAKGVEGRTEVRAPMAGKVVRVLVEEGESVDADQGLLVVEAMKMQNEMRAPASGRVERVAVAGGQRVNAGDLLAVLRSGTGR